jgi:hypothetical protein
MNHRKYELTLKILVKSPHDEDRVAHQMESLFEFGTITESIADGLKLNECPRLTSVSVKRVSTKQPR